MKLTLKERLANYLLKNEGWHASGAIQRLVAEKTTYTPQNVGRRLRELTEEGILEVEYRKGHSWYKHASGAILEPSDSELEGYLKAMDRFWRSIPDKV